MTVRDYIEQKFSSYGTLTEADILEFSLNTNLSPDEEVSKEILPEVELGMIGLIPSLLLRPTSVTESGFSISWDKDGLRRYYLYLCKQNDVTPEAVSGLGIISSYNDY
mgnify:FL=1